MKSMTGYGSGTATVEGSSLTLEMRAVNGKQRDIRCSLPPALAGAEAKLLSLLTGTIARGSISVSAQFTPSADLKQAGLRIDADLAASAAGRLRKLAETAGLTAEVSVSDLLSLPGIVSVESGRIPCEVADKLVLTAGEIALENFDASRLREGTHLQTDLASLHGELELLLTAMDSRQDDVLTHYRDRLLERIRLLDVDVKLDDERLAKEVAFAAQRSDVAEELTRLKAHLHSFSDLISADAEPVGRQLQFVCQEIHREINTLCSKASETATAQEGIQFKTILEKVREQIANVE